MAYIFTSKEQLEIDVKAGVDLTGVDLESENLEGADLEGAKLIEANLEGADLTNANLSNADLTFSDLTNANLSYSDLSYADLSNADLSYADLEGANLSNADLTYSDLSYADLEGANLEGADLTNANLEPKPSIKKPSSQDHHIIEDELFGKKQAEQLIRGISSMSKRQMIKTGNSLCDKEGLGWAEYNENFDNASFALLRRPRGKKDYKYLAKVLQYIQLRLEGTDRSVDATIGGLTQ